MPDLAETPVHPNTGSSDASTNSRLTVPSLPKHVVEGGPHGRENAVVQYTIRRDQDYRPLISLAKYAVHRNGGGMAAVVQVLGRAQTG